MKIIHAIFSFHVGGAETMLVDIINQQCKEASVSLIIINNELNPNLLHTIDKRIAVFLLNRKESSKIQLFPVYCKINKIVNKLNPDVIHCHDNKLLPFFIKWRKKTCLTVHNVNLSGYFLSYYQCVFAISTAVQQDVKKRSGIHAQVVFNGIEAGQYAMRTNYDFDPGKNEFKIIQISRLFPKQKGQHVAIRAMKILKEKEPDINMKLYFVGEGEALAELEALAVECNISDRIIFKGVVDREWIKNNLQNYHLLIQPSLFEGFGLTVAEGFAGGLPVIASDLDGPKEIIEMLNSGLLVKPNDPTDLAEKINLVINAYINKEIDKTKYCNRGELQLFDIKTTVKNYIQLYPTGKKSY